MIKVMDFIRIKRNEDIRSGKRDVYNKRKDFEMIAEAVGVKLYFNFLPF